MIRALLVVLVIIGCAKTHQFPDIMEKEAPVIMGKEIPADAPAVIQITTDRYRNNYRLQIHYKNMPAPAVSAEGSTLRIQFDKNTVFSVQAAEKITKYAYPCLYTGFYDIQMLTIELTCINNVTAYPELLHGSLDIILQVN